MTWADSITVEYSLGGSYALLTDSAGNDTYYFAGRNIGNRQYMSQVFGTGCDSCAGRTNQDFTYDSSGNRTSSEDARGNVTNYTYDSNGNVMQISRTVNGQTQNWNYTWNSFGEPLTATDPLSHQTVYTYDQLIGFQVGSNRAG